MGPVIGVSGKILKCPNCRPNRNYICSRCQARERGEQIVLEYFPRKRRPKDVIDPEKKQRRDGNVASEMDSDESSALSEEKAK